MAIKLRKSFERARAKNHGFSDRWIIGAIFLATVFLIFLRFADLQKRFFARDWFSAETLRAVAPWVIVVIAVSAALAILLNIRKRFRK